MAKAPVTSITLSPDEMSQYISRFKELRLTSDFDDAGIPGYERYEDKPEKNKFSHVHDALQYAFIGGGEGRALTMGGKSSRPVQARRDFDVFTRKPLAPKKRVSAL